MMKQPMKPDNASSLHLHHLLVPASFDSQKEEAVHSQADESTDIDPHMNTEAIYDRASWKEADVHGS